MINVLATSAMINIFCSLVFLGFIKILAIIIE